MNARPALADGFRLYWDEEEGTDVLLYPEGMIVLDENNSQILRCCSGERTIAEIIQELESLNPDYNTNQMVNKQLTHALNKGWLEFD